MKLRELEFWYWITSKLPKKLIYICFMNVLAEVTTGAYKHREPGEVLAMDAIKVYAKDHGIEK